MGRPRGRHGRRSRYRCGSGRRHGVPAPDLRRRGGHSTRLDSRWAIHRLRVGTRRGFRYPAVRGGDRCGRHRGRRRRAPVPAGAVPRRLAARVHRKGERTPRQRRDLDGPDDRRRAPAGALRRNQLPGGPRVDAGWLGPGVRLRHRRILRPGDGALGGRQPRSPDLAASGRVRPGGESRRRARSVRRQSGRPYRSVCDVSFRRRQSSVGTAYAGPPVTALRRRDFARTRDRTGRRDRPGPNPAPGLGRTRLRPEQRLSSRQSGQRDPLLPFDRPVRGYRAGRRGAGRGDPGVRVGSGGRHGARRGGRDHDGRAPNGAPL